MQPDCGEGGKHSPRVSHECVGGAGRMQEHDRPFHSEYDWKSYGHRIALWLQNNLENLFCGLGMLTGVRVCVREGEGGEVRRHRCWDFYLPPSSTFITNPSRVKWMLRCSKLTLRVTEAASAVCGITFHPNGMDGGLTTVTLTLLCYSTLPRLTRLSGAGWDEITDIHNLSSPSKNTAICQSQRYTHDGVVQSMWRH